MITNGAFVLLYILCAFKYLLLDASQFIGWILEGEITNARNSWVSKYIDVATIYYETDCTLWQGRSRFACWRTLDQETDLVSDSVGVFCFSNIDFLARLLGRSETTWVHDRSSEKIEVVPHPRSPPWSCTQRIQQYAYEVYPTEC
jgi:hypothetical protein